MGIHTIYSIIFSSLDGGISKINILMKIKIIVVIFKSDFCIEIQNFSKPSALNSLLYYSWQIWDSPDWNSYIPNIFYTEYLMRKVGWLCLFLTSETSENNSQIHFSSHNFSVQRTGVLDFTWGFPHLCKIRLYFFRALEYCLDVEKLNLTAIRTVRVLRPLRAINRIPSKWNIMMNYSNLKSA